MLLQQNLLHLKNKLLLFFFLHFIHIGRIGIQNIITIQIHCKSALFYLPKVRYLKWIPTIGSRLICYFLFIFFCRYKKQVNLFLVFIVKLLKILRHIETLIICNGSCIIEFVFEMRIKRVFSIIRLIMINCGKLIFHSFIFLMVKFFINYNFYFYCFFMRIVSKRQYRYSKPKRIFLLFIVRIWWHTPIRIRFYGRTKILLSPQCRNCCDNAWMFRPFGGIVLHTWGQNHFIFASNVPIRRVQYYWVFTTYCVSLLFSLFQNLKLPAHKSFSIIVDPFSVLFLFFNDDFFKLKLSFHFLNPLFLCFFLGFHSVFG